MREDFDNLPRRKGVFFMHEKYMQRALELASEFEGFTSPNPMVGAVIAKNGKIIGEGAHQKAGDLHAERIALQNATESPLDATMYVSLEPCCHHGKTPPCTDAIIESGIKTVVIAMQDPNPLVSGKGISLLKENKIEVITGVLEKQARKLNEIFCKNITQKKPFVIMKAAISLDGKIATPARDAKWISNDLARIEGHRLRSKVDGIVIGKNTLVYDDPKLNVRLEGAKKDPQKIVFIPKLDISLEDLTQKQVYILSKDKPLIVVAERSEKNLFQIQSYQETGIDLILLESDHNGLKLDQLMEELNKKNICSLLLEGGQQIYQSFLQSGLVDKIHLFIAPMLIGNDGISFIGSLGYLSINECMKIEFDEIKRIGDNIHFIGYPKSEKLCLQV